MAPKKASSVEEYRLTKLEEAMIETRRDIVDIHKEFGPQIRDLQDFVTKENAGGISMKAIVAVATVVSIILGGVFTAILRVAGLG